MRFIRIFGLLDQILASRCLSFIKKQQFSKNVNVLIHYLKLFVLARQCSGVEPTRLKIASGGGDVRRLFAKLNNSHFLTQSHYPTTQWTHSML